jgi:AcrR family transcriptional regulator
VKSSAQKANAAPEAKPGARMAAEERRRQIVEVAARLFSQKGFRGTTTKEIALAAGVNEAIIFRHFATKSDLYAAIIDHKACSDDVQALEAEADELIRRKDDRRLFAAIAEHILDFHDRDDTFMRLLFYSALEGHELADLFFRNHASRHFREVADYIKRRAADGAFRRVDPMTAARAFIGMVVYHSQLKRLYPSSVQGVSNRVVAERLTDLFLSGTLAAEAPARQRKK